MNRKMKRQLKRSIRRMRRLTMVVMSILALIVVIFKISANNAPNTEYVPPLARVDRAFEKYNDIDSIAKELDKVKLNYVDLGSDFGTEKSNYKFRADDLEFKGYLRNDTIMDYINRDKNPIFVAYMMKVFTKNGTYKKVITDHNYFGMCVYDKRLSYNRFEKSLQDFNSAFEGTKSLTKSIYEYCKYDLEWTKTMIRELVLYDHEIYISVNGLDK